jgi:Tfp pilus assembly protein PilZ
MFLFHSSYVEKVTTCAIFLPWCKEAKMVVNVSERRISLRLPLKTALQVRIWKSGSAQRRTESVNLSQTGAFFATDVPIAIGSAIEILLKMPEEVTGKPATEWRCSGRVVRLQPVDTPQGKFGVGIEFDYYEILRSKAAAQLETAEK